MKDNNIFTPEQPLNSAVLFLVFNRLNTTKQVFEAIQKAKPPRLYIAADGPRKGRDDEDQKVKSVRDYIMTNIDWKCDVKTLFREQNLGCKLAVSGAIDWFFENEEMGIILEDDCVPSQSFFWFCEELLEKYKYDMRVFIISGYNKQNEWEKQINDYFFSNFGGIWGWASWRRAWKHYDVEMSDIEVFIDQNNFEKQLGKRIGSQRQNTIYSNIILKNVDTWDYQWAYTRHKNNGLACVPKCSLIENIGYGDDATHTFGLNNDNVIKHEITFPLKTNEFIVADTNYDAKFIKQTSLFNIVKNKLFKKK
jgi:hypothetical protein